MKERPVALITTTSERIVPLVLPACRLAQASLVVVQTLDALLDCWVYGILYHTAPLELEAAIGQWWVGRSRDLLFLDTTDTPAPAFDRWSVYPTGWYACLHLPNEPEALARLMARTFWRVAANDAQRARGHPPLHWWDY